MLQIDDDTVFAVFRESVAVHAHIVGGGHLSDDAVVELHGIIARLGLLVLVRKGEGVFLIDDGGLANERGDENVAVVLTAGAVKMRVRESVDAAVAVMVGGTAVPAFQPRVRAHLNGAERQDRARVGVPVLVRAHERVNILRLRRCDRNHRDQNQEESEFFHISFVLLILFTIH